MNGPATSGGENAGFWLPAPASQASGTVDGLFYFILGISIFFFVLITALLVYFAWRYRYRAGAPVEKSPSHHTGLEITWSAIPLALVIPIFIWGFRGYLELRTPERDAIEIQVTGQKWKWLFSYPNGHVDDVLHVPVSEPVRLVMTSADVLHSFFIPVFRIKMDVLPDRYTKLGFRATEVGEFDVFCTEYCGKDHSKMVTKIVVHRPGEYEVWLEEAGAAALDLPPVELGELMYKRWGCGGCHAKDDKKGMLGPSFKGLFGLTRTFMDGTTSVADENYIRESVSNPAGKVVQGYNPVMPPFQGKFNDREMTGIVEMIKSLK